MAELQPQAIVVARLHRRAVARRAIAVAEAVRTAVVVVAVAVRLLAVAVRAEDHRIAVAHRTAVVAVAETRVADSFSQRKKRLNYEKIVFSSSNAPRLGCSCGTEHLGFAT